MWFSTSSGRIELRLTREQAATGSHPGACDADVAHLRTVPAIRRQLDKIAPDVLRAELREYGAWDAVELRDHDRNLSRILWLACGDIADAERAAG
jgi:hypothetical protein